MALELYRQKRNFRNTPEPRGKVLRSDARDLRFIIQKHRASHLHYDFRLELDGVLLSWAVPKGPSLDPKQKRLAMHVEDHPIEYGDFEGVIPPGQYGSGTVMLWDRGRWIPEDDDPRAAYRKGKLKFTLDGERLKGSWALVRSWGQGKEDKRWLLLKHDDDFAQAGSGSAVVDEEDRSVVTGRDLDEIAAAKDAEWSGRKSVAANVKAGALKPTAALDPSKLDGARKAKMPAMVGAQLCTLVKQVPPGSEWLHEIKYDGYRMLTRLEDRTAAIYSRNRKEWTEDLGPVAKVVGALPVQQAWLDGEVVVLLPDGRSSFQALQLAIGTDNQQLTYFVFDLLYLDGWDLRACALVERKELLRKLLAGRKGVIRYGDHHEGDGERFFAAACAGRLEGIICKQRDGAYHATRGSGWVKVKCSLRQELVIGGWTDPGGARTGFGALLLGAYDDNGKLGYAGKVGTGFDTKTLKDIHARLRKLGRDTPAFANPPRGADARGAHWVEPKLVGEIEFTEWTREGTARHPSFKGLRLDKAAKDVRIERPAEALDIPVPVGKSARFKKRAVVADSHPRTVELTNPDKVLYPEAGITKSEIAEYYRAIGAWMLPHLEGRPLTLVRCPSGYASKCFYQKHVKDGTPEILTRVKVPEGDGSAIYMAADSIEAIVALLQMNVLEIHPWGSRVPKLGFPDRMIFDFDPDEGLGWQEVVDAAKTMRDALEKLGLACFLKTTGGKGLHVVVPIEPKQPWDVVKAFTKAVADSFAATWPERFTAKLAKASRGSRIFIDYLRNAEGATAIAPYSVRAKPNAPVATPIAWNELRNEVRFDHFNLRNVPARLKRMKNDPWADFLSTRQSLTKAMLKSVGVST